MKDLAMHILDIAHNSITAKATKVEISVSEEVKNDVLTIEVKDNGKGMSEEMVNQVIDPFVTSRKTRKVGLGIPLFKQNAEMSDGKLELSSELGKGTILKATFQHSHIDRPAMGDLTGVIIGLASGTENVEFVYTHKYNDKSFVFDTVEVKEALDGMSLALPEIRRYLKEMIDENVKEIVVN
jgi:hypothetical protein